MYDKQEEEKEEAMNEYKKNKLCNNATNNTMLQPRSNNNCNTIIMK